MSGAGDGIEVWRGPSAIDGKPVAVVVTHLTEAPMNRKIGDMAQAWILPVDVAPVEAARNGEDARVCGTCRFRPSEKGGCYVQIWATSQRVWWAWSHGSYPPGPLLLDKPLRIGAWGDPGAVPLEVWRDLVLPFVPAWTAYTHRWVHLDARAWGFCMASVDSPAEARRAQTRGWRTFRVRLDGAPLVEGERICPSAEEAPTHGRVACDKCRLCDGTAVRASKPSIAIIAHGQAIRRAEDVVSTPAGARIEPGRARSYWNAVRGGGGS